jgi:hypothetical protein
VALATVLGPASLAAGGRQPGPPWRFSFYFSVPSTLKNRRRESGKPAFGFPHSRRSSELWESGNPARRLAGFPRGWGNSWKACRRLSTVSISPVISTALRAVRSGASHSRGASGDSTFTWRNSIAFAWRIFRAASVSLMRPARRSRLSRLIPGLRNFSASGTRFSLS